MRRFLIFFIWTWKAYSLLIQDLGLPSDLSILGDEEASNTNADFWTEDTVSGKSDDIFSEKLAPDAESPFLSEEILNGLLPQNNDLLTDDFYADNPSASGCLSIFSSKPIELNRFAMKKISMLIFLSTLVFWLVFVYVTLEVCLCDGL